MVWRVADINCYDVIGYQFPRLESEEEEECEKGFSEPMLVEVFILAIPSISMEKLPSLFLTK